MSVKCPYCGSLLADGTKFCTACGAKLEIPEAKAAPAPGQPVGAVPDPVPAPEAVPAPAPAAAAQSGTAGASPSAVPSYCAPVNQAGYSAPGQSFQVPPSGTQYQTPAQTGFVPAAAPAPVNSGEYTEKPAGFFEYFGLMLLFGIPVLGFIFKIIFAFTPKKKSLRNFSWVMLLFEVIAVVLSVIMIILAVSLIDNIVQFLEEWKENMYR